MTKISKRLVLIGGGAHAYAVRDLFLQSKAGNFVGYCDLKPTDLELKYLGDDSQLLQMYKGKEKQIFLVMGVGTDLNLREKLFKLFKSKGFQFASCVHSSVVKGFGVTIKEGSVIFPLSVLGAGVCLEENVCVYGHSVIEHRSRVGAHTYISPSVAVAGDCQIGKACLLGIHACTLEKIKIADGVKIGAGAVVLKSVLKKSSTVVGVPAKELSK